MGGGNHSFCTAPRQRSSERQIDALIAEGYRATQASIELIRAALARPSVGQPIPVERRE